MTAKCLRCWPSDSYNYDTNDELMADGNHMPKLGFDFDNNMTGWDSTNTWGYDNLNRMMFGGSNSVSYNYYYDGDNIRYGRTGGAASVFYVVDDVNPSGYPQVLEEITQDGSSGALTRVYNYGTSLICQRNEDSLSLHKYLYAEGDPVNLMDPSGKDISEIGFDIGLDIALFSIRNFLVSTGTLTERQIANIVFNETRSLSGSTLDQARQNVAHAIINGDELQASGKGRRPKSASTAAKVLAGEAGAYQDCLSTVIAAKLDWVDPTSGGIHFNLRKNNWRGPFQGHPIRTQNGPFLNSYPTSELPATGIYVNTYE